MAVFLLVVDVTCGSSNLAFSLRWWPVSTPRSSSRWSIRKSTWQTTCWPGNTSASGSADFRPSRCPTCPPTAWRSVPASWTCGQCPPPLVMERESPRLGGFITASYQITEKKKFSGGDHSMVTASHFICVCGFFFLSPMIILSHHIKYHGTDIISPSLSVIQTFFHSLS